MREMGRGSGIGLGRGGAANVPFRDITPLFSVKNRASLAPDGAVEPAGNKEPGVKVPVRNRSKVVGDVPSSTIVKGVNVPTVGLVKPKQAKLATFSVAHPSGTVVPTGIK
jgi:hypothetical protein